MLNKEDKSFHEINEFYPVFLNILSFSRRVYKMICKQMI